MSIMQYLVLIILGGILTLDRTAFLQWMISRPIVTGPLAGLVIGDLNAGMACGVLIEPIWLSRQPVGGYIPPDETVATIAAVAAAAGFSQFVQLPGNVLFAIPVALPFAWVGRYGDIKVRLANGKDYKRLKGELAGGNLIPVGQLHMRGVQRFFISGLISTAVSVFGAFMIARTLGGLMGPILSGTDPRYLNFLIPVVGAGALISGLGGKKVRVAFAAGLAAALFLMLGGGMA